MLNISTISAGSGMDYLTDAVATGMHDYYAGHGEAAGVWWGSGAETLGLSGEVDIDHVERAFGSALHPTKEEVLGRAHPLYRTVAERISSRVEALGSAPDPDLVKAIEAHELRKGERTANGGYDLTFRPVKSVSALWAVAPADTRAVIQGAHDDAVAAALDWVQANVASTRAGRDGVRALDVDGITVARFTHRTSRNGDPLLHTHCAVLNRVRTSVDGEWRALDGHRLYEASAGINARYTATIEALLTERLGVSWTPRPDGLGREIAGIGPDVIGAWSSRRAQIERRFDQLAEDYRQQWGSAPSRAAKAKLYQQATLETRAAKTDGPAGLHERWRSEFTTITGEDPDAVVQRVTPGAASPPAPAGGLVDDIDGLAARAIAHVEAQRATWTDHHIAAAAVHLSDGLVASRSQEVDTVLGAVQQRAQELAVPLPHARPIVAGPARRSGRSVYDSPAAHRWTSRRILDAENVVLDSGRRQRASIVDDHLVADAITRHSLSNDQAAATWRLATDPAGTQALIGPAGAGKTRTVGAIGDAWTAAGGTVLGLAVSQTAAEVLRDSLVDAGVDEAAVTVDNITRALDHSDALHNLSPDTLIVVDEAGMAPTLGLARLVEAADEAGARVLLVGDHRQLGAVEAGGMFRAFVAEHGGSELTEIHRFQQPWERAASQLLRAQREEVIDTYDDHGRITGGTADTMADAALRAWIEDTLSGRESIIVAPTNDLATELSRKAQTALTAAGLLAQRRQLVDLVDGNQAGEGDTITTRRNNREIPAGQRGDFVKNRDAWIVQKVDRDGALTVKHQGHGGRATLPAEYVAAHVELGYAGTVHAAQGRTVDTCHGLVDVADTSEALYVGATRGRERNHLWVATDVADEHAAPVQQTPHAVLAHVLGRSGVERTAGEHLAAPTETLDRLIPAASDARQEGHGEVARELEMRISARRAEIQAQLVANVEPWLVEVRAGARDPWLAEDVALDVAAWREQHRVSDPVSPLGPEATAPSPGRARLAGRLDDLRREPGPNADLAELDGALWQTRHAEQRRTLQRRLDALGHGPTSEDPRRLLGALADREARGHDPMDVLADAVEHARAAGTTLRDAIDHTPDPVPRGLTDPGPDPQDLARTDHLADRVRDAEAAIGRAAVLDHPTWTDAVPGPDSRPRRQLIADIAIWRARHGQAGPEPLGAAGDRTGPERDRLAQRLDDLNRTPERPRAGPQQAPRGPRL